MLLHLSDPQSRAAVRHVSVLPRAIGARHPGHTMEPSSGKRKLSVAGRRRRMIKTRNQAAAISIITHLVCVSFGIPVAQMRARTRCRAPIAFARQVAMYLAHIGPGMTLTDIGAGFGRDRTTAAHACATVEDRRDDPVLDVSLDCLEHAVHCCLYRYGFQNRRAGYGSR